MHNQNESEMLAEMFANFIEQAYADGRIDDAILEEFLESFCIDDIRKFSISELIDMLIVYTENKRIKKTLLNANIKIIKELLDMKTEIDIQKECENWFKRRKEELASLIEERNRTEEEIRLEEDERPK